MRAGDHPHLYRVALHEHAHARAARLQGFDVQHVSVVVGATLYDHDPPRTDAEHHAHAVIAAAGIVLERRLGFPPLPCHCDGPGVLECDDHRMRRHLRGAHPDVALVPAAEMIEQHWHKLTAAAARHDLLAEYGANLGADVWRDYHIHTAALG